MRDFLAIRAQTSGTYRMETLGGTQYVVVPVVALVEGVIQGITAEKPELALASEFGRFPASWNGRPITIDHPWVHQDPLDPDSPVIRVSAALAPEISEQFQVGFIFNTQVKGDKLTMEAWIDPVKMSRHSETARKLLQNIKKGEVVEVSTGLFTGSEPTPGSHDGEEYFAVWRGVVPDHLALLPEGLVGACSAEDGCGANVQANQANQRRAPDPRLHVHQGHKLNANLQTNCGCGGTCPRCTTPSPNPSGRSVAATHADRPNSGAGNTASLFNAGDFLANIMPDGMMDMDIRSILQTCIDKDYPDTYAYLIGFTKSMAVYSAYDATEGTRATYQCSYSINSFDKSCTMGTPTQVTLTTQITPVPQERQMTTAANQNAQAQPNANAAPASTTTNEATTQQQQAAPATTQQQAPAAVQQQAAPATVQQVAANTATTEAAKPQTVAEYLASAPAEVRAALESGMRMHENHKSQLIANLKASGRCKFTDDQLKTFDVPMLENLVELAKVPVYDGVAPAGDAMRQNVQQTTANANAGDLPYAPPPPRLGITATGNRGTTNQNTNQSQAA